MSSCAASTSCARPPRVLADVAYHARQDQRTTHVDHTIHLIHAEMHQVGDEMLPCENGHSEHRGECQQHDPRPYGLEQPSHLATPSIRNAICAPESLSPSWRENKIQKSNSIFSPKISLAVIFNYITFSHFCQGSYPQSR